MKLGRLALCMALVGLPVLSQAAVSADEAVQLGKELTRFVMVQ